MGQNTELFFKKGRGQFSPPIVYIKLIEIFVISGTGSWGMENINYKKRSAYLFLELFAI